MIGQGYQIMTIKLTKEQILEQIRLMAAQTDRLLEAQRMVMDLQQQIFHEKWKFRYVARKLRQYAPHEAISEEELDEQIKQKQN